MTEKKARVAYSAKNKVILQELAESLNMSMGEAIDYLIENRHKINSSNKVSSEKLEGYTTTEEQEIEDAVINSGESLESITHVGRLQRARYLNTVYKKQADFESLSLEELRGKNFKGVSEYRISKAVEKIMVHNDRQPEKANKLCVTQGLVAKITNSNRYNIKNFFQKHKIMIDDHNAKHDLRGVDNRKTTDFKKYLGIEK